jgi:hypothetical protein
MSCHRRRHYERVTDSAEAKAVKDRRSAVLWVWRAHNEVNERLAKIEAKYGHSSTGDAAFPKVRVWSLLPGVCLVYAW